LLILCTISKSTSRWTTLMKITLPNSSLINSYAHPKLQHFHKCNNLHLAILANLWIQIFPPPPPITSGHLQFISTLTFQIKSKLKIGSHTMMVKSANFSLITTLSPCHSIFSN
jgi:hypothetical protein